MIIVNADDFGRSREETDVVLACYAAGRITSTTAMVFMPDSERAAAMANERGLEVGLHLNLCERFGGSVVPAHVRRSHDRVVAFLSAGKYTVLLYNPFLREHFRRAIDAQLHEFLRLYGRRPTHIDGHRHQHLCANVLLDRMLPPGCRVRRSFSFWPGEKSAINRAYRRAVDRRLARSYVIGDYFFSLQQCLRSGRMARVFGLAESGTVELMTHPRNQVEFEYLMSDQYMQSLRKSTAGSYALVS
jgi:predicted glycoside hydrolase/deacetylase ChbG (UPF0249 family)